MTNTSITSTTDLMDTPASSQAMNGPFEKPESTQTSSALMQLPAEVRLKIYGYLLNNGSVLQPQKHFETITNKEFRLSTQALRTCQLFYREGSQVLYDKNVLGIRIGAKCFYDRMRFFILDKPVAFKYHDMNEIKKLETFISTKLEIEAKTDFQIEMPRGENATGRFDRLFHKAIIKNLSWLNRHLDSLHRYKNLDVKIDYPNEEHLYAAIYMIADFLKGKNVILRAYGHPPASLPAILTSLRCEKFTLAYPDVDEFNAYVAIPSLYSHQKQLTLRVEWPDLNEEIFDTIVGDTPVEDLLPEYNEFLSTIKNIFPINIAILGLAKSQLYISHIWLLRYAVMRQERADFYEQARALLGFTRRLKLDKYSTSLMSLQDQIERARNFEVDDKVYDEEDDEGETERTIRDLQARIDRLIVTQTDALAALDDLETSLHV